MRCSIAAALAGWIIDPVHYLGKFIVTDFGKVGAFRVEAACPVGVVIGPTLPGAVRVGKEHT